MIERIKDSLLNGLGWLWIVLIILFGTIYYDLNPTTVSAQGSQTIYKTVFTSAISGTASTPVQNIGQSAHALTVQFINAPAQICVSSTAFMFIRLEASTDNANWFPIGAAIQTAAATVTFTGTVHTTLAYGVYPFVRVNYLAGDDTLCRVKAFYGGSLFPAAINAAQILNSNNYDFTQFILLTTNASPQIAVVGQTGLQTVVYGYLLNAQTTNHVQLYYSADNSCISVHQIIFDGYITGGTSASMSASTVPISTSIPGDRICLGPGTPAGNISLSLVYRYE